MSSGGPRRPAAEKRIVIISAAGTRCGEGIRRTLTREKFLLPDQGKPPRRFSPDLPAGSRVRFLQPRAGVGGSRESPEFRGPGAGIWRTYYLGGVQTHGTAAKRPGRDASIAWRTHCSSFPAVPFRRHSSPSPRPRGLARPDGKHERGSQHESAIDEESNLVTPNINQGAQSHRSQHKPEVPNRAI